MPIKIEISDIPHLTTPTGTEYLLGVSSVSSSMVNLLPSSAIGGGSSIVQDADGNFYRLSVLVQDGIPMLSQPQLIE
jgi:hypothetical protein